MTSLCKRLCLIASIFTLAPAMAGGVALKNVNVVDVVSLQVVPNQTVVIENDKIARIIDRKNPRLDRDVTVIDMTDKYLIPGLIDTHVHHATSPDDYDNDEITRTRLRKLLRGGVTSVRDMGGDTRALSSLQRRANADLIQSPDIYYSVIIGGKEFFSDPRTVASARGRVPGEVDWMRAVDESTDLDQVMQRALGTGASGIKIYARVPAELMAPLKQAASRHGLKTWSHVFVGPARPLDAVKAGVETVSHAPDISAHVVENFYELRRENKPITDAQKAESFELERYQDLIAAMQANDTIVDATLTVFEQRKAARGERGELMYDWAKAFTRLVHENGIKIAVGTDATSDSSNKDYPMVQHEMQLLVKDVGLTPLEALQAATRINAEVIGLEATTGTVEAGKMANLVVLNSDPSDNIENALDIAHVIKNGRFVHRGDLPGLPFTSARPAGGMLWMSGQIGNIPSTKVLVDDSIEGQMRQAMENFGPILEEYNLDYEDVVKCTLMLDDIDDWPAANTVYRTFFQQFPARSAYATGGLALGAKVEVECIAEL